MTGPYEPYDSLKERTRRVLADNHQQLGTRSFVLPPLGPAGMEPAGVEPTALQELENASERVVLETAAAQPAVLEPTVVGPAVVDREAKSWPEGAPAALGADQASAPEERHGGHPAHEGTDYMELIRLRMWAIRTVRDLYPKQVCAAQRVRELSGNLAGTAGDSVHYRVILDKLKEAHEEWLSLEERLWQANDAIRSTQWLVELLAEPAMHGGTGNVAG